MTDAYELRTATAIRRWRTIFWAGAAMLLLAPLIAMRLTDEVAWSVSDFAVFGAMLAGVGAAYELLARKARDAVYRAAVGLALLGVFLLIWINGAVGIIGSERNGANLMYAGVLAIGIAGAVAARFRPNGMAIALVATAFAQTLVAVIALIERAGIDSPAWPTDLLLVTALFDALWLASAGLFRRAARRGDLST